MLSTQNKNKIKYKVSRNIEDKATKIGKIFFYFVKIIRIVVEFSLSLDIY